MTEATHYTLRYCRADSRHQAGERLAAAGRTVRIGQQPDCDVLLDNDTPYVPELLAVITPAAEGRWLLIPVSEHARTLVGGAPVGLVHQLADGDTITFDGAGTRQQLRFHTHTTATPDLSDGARRLPATMPRWLVVLLVVLPVALFLGLALHVRHLTHEDDRRQALAMSLRPSVVQLSVDTFLYVQTVGGRATVLQTYILSAHGLDATTGTAFLTTDSLLVTARHCVEPWLNIPAPPSPDSTAHELTPARWALMAETWNQLHPGDTTRAVVSIVTLTDSLGQPLLPAMRSTDFAIDRSRDELIETGDFRHAYYWRSLRPRYARRDMMLGDIATVRMPRAGRIELPRRLDGLTEGRRVTILGYPDFQLSGLERTEGQLKRTYRTGDMLAHDGQLKGGYSGGPVLLLDNGRPTAIGVVSVIDPKGGNRTYSVPTLPLPKGSK